VTDLSTAPSTAAAHQVASAHAIRTAVFSRSRHGLDEREVRAYLDRLALEVEAAQSERTGLRTEVAELREEVARLRTEREPDDEQIRQEISVRAVELLSRAQQAADDAVAEAEQYARDLVMTAREQYRDVLHKAQEAAAETVREVPEPDGAAATGYLRPVPEVEYVRTYARVAQVQLRSVLDALTAEVDKLGELPQLGGGAPRRARAEEHEPDPAPAARWLPDLADVPEQPDGAQQGADEPEASAPGR